jgi:hypothetical protein
MKVARFARKSGGEASYISAQDISATIFEKNWKSFLREPLGRTDAIESSRIIRPLRIAEIKQTVGKRESLEWSPNRAGQIGAGFHHDGDIGCAGDVETKLIVTYAKTRTASFYQRVPQHGRKTFKRVAPPGATRRVIDRRVGIKGRRVVVRSEYSRISGGSVALEINAGQIAALPERIISEVGDAAGNGDARQACAGPECAISDAGNAIVDCRVCQLATVFECTAPMLVTLPGIVTLVRLGNEANTEYPMSVIPEANVALVKLVLCWKTASKMSAGPVRSPGMVTFVRFSQNPKASFPMLVRLAGMVRLVKPVPMNAYCPMLVTLAGIMTLARLEQ